MPELPEVETIRRQMEAALLGRRIKKIDVRYAGRLFLGDSTTQKKIPAAQFAKALEGAAFSGFTRRAKLLMVHFDNGMSLAVHLKMTGKFLLKDDDEQPGKHTHVVFHLDAKTKKNALFFDDVRKFGYLKLIKTEDLEKLLNDKENYGPEPLDPSFTLKVMEDCLAKRGGKKIKPLLMDQTCIAGIGNIYADEALWHAKVRPTRLAKSLKPQELKDLHVGIQDSLNESLKHRGASADNYRDLNDEEGESVPFLHAYGKSHCPRCKGTMKKIYIGQRVAHFCPTCQK